VEASAVTGSIAGIAEIVRDAFGSGAANPLPRNRGSVPPTGPAK